MGLIGAGIGGWFIASTDFFRLRKKEEGFLVIVGGGGASTASFRGGGIDGTVFGAFALGIVGSLELLPPPPNTRLKKPGRFADLFFEGITWTGGGGFANAGKGGRASMCSSGCEL